MSFLRSFGSAIIGYLIFAFSAFGFFQLSGQPPHQAAPLSVMVASIAVGAVAAALGGYVAAFLAGYRPLLHGALVATILATGAVVSLVSTLGYGSIWSQLSALVVMAPSAVIGGWLRAKQSGRV